MLNDSFKCQLPNYVKSRKAPTKPNFKRIAIRYVNSIWTPLFIFYLYFVLASRLLMSIYHIKPFDSTHSIRARSWGGKLSIESNSSQSIDSHWQEMVSTFGLTYCQLPKNIKLTIWRIYFRTHTHSYEKTPQNKMCRNC